MISKLMIGSWIASGKVYNPETSTIGKVLEIGNEEREFEQIYCECEESFEWFFKDNYCGIPITPSILERCGFVYTMDAKHHLWDENLWLIQTNEGWGCEVQIATNKPEWAQINTIKYLHELQLLTNALGVTMEIEL